MNLSQNSTNIQRQLDYLYALDGKGIKPGLKRVLEFLARIGNPQTKLTVVHVAGTNGKGSTCAMLSSVLAAAGYRVGLYTSPHLVRFNERIRINGEKISDSEIVGFLNRYRHIIEEIDTTFFETTTAMAFEYFVKNAVDVAILETGLGGRFDATNVVTPLLSVISSIGKDHEEFLGNTLAKITMEKAGIIKPGVPVVSARQRPGVRQLLEKEARRNNSPFIYAPDYCRVQVRRRFPDRQLVTVNSARLHIDELDFPFLGDHQRVNLNTVVAALENLNALSVDRESVEWGISAARWHGRLELLSENPTIYYDVGHNLHGIRQIVRTLRKIFPGDKFKILIALGRRKKIEALGKVLSKLADEIYVAEIPNGKSIPAIMLADAIKPDFPTGKIVIEPDLALALEKIVRSLEAKDKLLILGSHYFSSSVYDFFKINV